MKNLKSFNQFVNESKLRSFKDNKELGEMDVKSLQDLLDKIKESGKTENDKEYLTKLKKYMGIVKKALDSKSKDNPYGEYESASDIGDQFIEYAWDFIGDPDDEKDVLSSLKRFLSEGGVDTNGLTKDERWTIASAIDSEGLAGDQKVYKALGGK